METDWAHNIDRRNLEKRYLTDFTPGTIEVLNHLLETCVIDKYVKDESITDMSRATRKFTKEQLYNTAREVFGVEFINSHPKISKTDLCNELVNVGLKNYELLCGSFGCKNIPWTTHRDTPMMFHRPTAANKKEIEKIVQNLNTVPLPITKFIEESRSKSNNETIGRVDKSINDIITNADNVRKMMQRLIEMSKNPSTQMMTIFTYVSNSVEQSIAAVTKFKVAVERDLPKHRTITTVEDVTDADEVFQFLRGLDSKTEQNIILMIQYSHDNGVTVEQFQEAGFSRYIIHTALRRQIQKQQSKKPSWFKDYSR
jgi:hypothetical protein